MEVALVFVTDMRVYNIKITPKLCWFQFSLFNTRKVFNNPA